jgi:uncharacterized membrane protein YuzA (DUF378 family)
MRKLAYVITLVVFAFSVVAIYSLINDVVGGQGRFMWRLLLSIVGIAAFITLMLHKRIFVLLNIIWFLPQVIVLAERFVDPVYDAYAERTVYDLTLSVSSILVLGFEKAPDVFLRIGFNLVGIAGLILSIAVAARFLRSGKDAFPGRNKEDKA